MPMKYQWSLSDSPSSHVDVVFRRIWIVVIYNIFDNLNIQSMSSYICRYQNGRLSISELSKDIISFLLALMTMQRQSRPASSSGWICGTSNFLFDLNRDDKCSNLIRHKYGSLSTCCLILKQQFCFGNSFIPKTTCDFYSFYRFRKTIRFHRNIDSVGILGKRKNWFQIH